MALEIKNKVSASSQKAYFDKNVRTKDNGGGDNDGNAIFVGQYSTLTVSNGFTCEGSSSSGLSTGTDGGCLGVTDNSSVTFLGDEPVEFGKERSRM